jgi:hypothetical protein
MILREFNLKKLKRFIEKEIQVNNNNSHQLFPTPIYYIIREETIGGWTKEFMVPLLPKIQNILDFTIRKYVNNFCCLKTEGPQNGGRVTYISYIILDICMWVFTLKKLICFLIKAGQFTDKLWSLLPWISTD